MSGELTEAEASALRKMVGQIGTARVDFTGEEVVAIEVMIRRPDRLIGVAITEAGRRALAASGQPSAGETERADG